MPQSSYSSKRAPKSSAKNAHPRPSTPESNIIRSLDMSSKANLSRKSANAQASDRKRRASSSSVSSVSSVSSLGDLSDEADDSEEDADDEQEPAARAPSYGRRRDNKAGRQSAINKRRRVLNDSSDSSDDNDGNDSDDSSDDVYAGVDYITDAEDEDQDVEKLEEMMIVESEKTHRPLPSAGFADDQWAINSFDDHMFLPAASFFDEEHLYSAMDTFGEPQVTSEAAETPVARRVHFEERSDSSSDSDSHSDDDIPGDFLQQDSLDPQLRRMIENDNENYQRNTRRQSEEMFGDADYGHGSIYHVESEGSSEGSLSGYESDDGDTTDEDLPPQQLSPTPDPHKPVALVDCTGKHLVIIPAYASSRHDWLDSAANSMPGTANTSPRQTTLHLVDESDTDALASPNQLDFSPMLASSANLMMTALGNDLTPGGQVMGPPEAFYPSQDFTIDSSFEEDEEDDPEAALNVDDFIDFGNGSSDEDEDMDKQFDEDARISPMAVPFAKSMGTPTPTRKSELQNSEERFLNHLDKGIVTAFRRNHNRYQALLRLPQHREFMPANSPARPASVFRHAKNNDQRTPTRKRKSSSIAGGEAVRRKLMDAQQRRSQHPITAPL
ncbi:hypothetical protein N7491_011045 [Penicillium cf. griseofulvum]|nr:hypothetical protein N7491_011045 [Penicillium cf. griseofulvum]